MGRHPTHSGKVQSVIRMINILRGYMQEKHENYDVAVIGGGHAGIEAALAAARMGARTIIFTLSLDYIGNMPCNPSIGGTGKGHLVFEIDALGGEMGKVADATMTQCRMLNASKGPAVHSLRFQSDRRKYALVMKNILEHQPNLDIYQAEITEILFDNAADISRVIGVKTRVGEIFHAPSVVIACGTYLSSSIIIGESSVGSGPDNGLAAGFLSDNLKSHGIEMLRFKTGTPARVHADSVNYDALEIQHGDERITRFSGDDGNSGLVVSAQAVCHIAYTNETTHQIIRDNLHRSPMYAGTIHGTGARYCPSIEDKIVRFADKDRHQIFVEPMGDDTKEMYLQGLSTSMPLDVQKQIIRSIKGLESAKIMRPAYAIEYDCCDPLQLRHTLEFREYAGLFGAGQFNGTSGYEEAAAQGLIAGINAAISALSQSDLRDVKDAVPCRYGANGFTLDRSSSYIGMLIDDLVTKGTKEPYRVLTSRTEYRLSLRQDNADERLMAMGVELGLVSEARYLRLQQKLSMVAAEIERVKVKNVYPTESVNKILKDCGSSEMAVACKLIDLLKRPELNYDNLRELDDSQPDNAHKILELALIKIKYEGYIKREEAEIARHKKLEGRVIPRDLDYSELKGLRIEAVQKLAKMRPGNIGEASRISGVTPADITALLIWLDKYA